ncbi:hypothetical protein OUZ56_011340 [Daphnia magna]|uniref:Uncharacterized protein n=1 Tax=Daphnia magna TaxID=35525 RepID=A0ABQ9Z010_9CRUS|nr:hypothetical protein OUZ56_011340 [Daphnia magna]
MVESEDHDYSEPISSDEISQNSLKKEQATRWNSTLTSIESVLENRVVIRELLSSEQFDSPHLILTNDEMSLLKKLAEFLKPFRCQTDALQGDRYPTISLISPAIQVLLRQCDVEAPQESSYAATFPSDLDGSVLNPIFRLATTLDIRFKTNKSSFKTVVDFVDAINYYDRKLGPLPPSEPSAASSTPTENSMRTANTTAPSSSSKKIKISALYGIVLDAEPATNGTREELLKAEMQNFLAIPRLSADEMDELGVHNISFVRGHNQSLHVWVS